MLPSYSASARVVVFLLAVGQAGCSSLLPDGLFGGKDDAKDQTDPTGQDHLEAGGPAGAPPTFGAPGAPTLIPLGAPLWLANDGISGFAVVDRGDDHGAVLRLSPGAPPVVLADDVFHPTGLAVDGARVYYAAGKPDGGWTYLRVLDKTTGVKIADAFGTGASDTAFTAVSLQGDTVAWASRADSGGAIYRGLADGIGVVTVAHDQGSVAAVAVAGPWVYWARNTELFRKRSGAPPDAAPELVAERGLFTSVVSDGLDVYAASDDGTIIATSAADETPVLRVLGGTLLAPRALAVDPWFVYVVATTTSSVVAVNRLSGRTVEVWKGGDPWTVTALPTGLWVADRAGRTLSVVPKIPAAP